jgi:3-(3-hydroxy-phenyl)propionate hydroxylase
MHHLALSVVAMGASPDRLQEADSVLASWFARANAVAALVRPDHYVYGVVATLADVSVLIESAANHYRTPLKII